MAMIAITPSDATPALETGCRGVEWIDLAEAERRSGWGARHLRRLCEGWEAAGLARRVAAVQGGKPRWDVREDAHVKLARVKLPGQIAADLSDLTRAQRAEVAWRFAVLSAWEVAVGAMMRGAGRTKVEATRAFLAAFPPELTRAEEATPTESTLYRWDEKFRAEGRRGLVDRRWLNGSETDPRFAPMLEEVRRLYLDQRQPKLRRCWRAAAGKAKKLGWAECSYDTARRFIESVGGRELIRRRGGPKAYKEKAGSFIVRDYSTMASNEVWQSDGHQFDAWVSVPGQERPVRPWTSLWIDVRSRRVVGWVIVPHAPNTDTILQAFRAACLANGVPETVYIDNGKDYDATALQGQTKRQRQRKGEAEQSGGLDAGVFPGLGIRVVHAQPYHPQAKLIERFFRTVEDQFCRMEVDTYCGNSPAHKPENLPARMERGQAPTLEEFTALFARYLDTDYHVAPHEGSGMNGKCPDDVYRDNLVSLRTTSADVLDELLLKPSRPLGVGRNGVRCDHLTYDAPELDAWFGKQVRLRVDPADVNRARVYDLEDRFIGVATATATLPANASAQEVRDAIATKRRREKLRRAARAEAMHLAEDVGEHIARKRREDAAAARAAAAGESSSAPPPPPVVQMIQSKLAAQAQQIKRGLGQAARKAVGAESIDWVALTDGLDVGTPVQQHPAVARLYQTDEVNP
jgi:putative transposase